MRKRIFRSVWLTAAVVALASLLVAFGMLYRYFSALEADLLPERMEWVMAGVERNGVDYLTDIRGKETRVTWVAADGTVLYDTQSDAAAMENHRNREEVAAALKNGVGRGERTSATLAERTLYYARRLTDGTVLRVSVTQSTALSLAMGTVPSLVLLLGLAALLSALLAGRLARRIAGPVNGLDLEHPLENDTYEELSPLLNRIEQPPRQLEARMRELKRAREELAAVTESMNEGLILLNEQGKVLSLNPAACRVFRTDENCVGKDMLLVDRSRAVADALAQAAREGRGEGCFSREGREYQLEASRVGGAAHPEGMALIVFDVTERANGERNRREFTANVSHELKTPLQSILGRAELMENGLVKPEDMRGFAGHIRNEAQRMIRLIEDVIRLSRLDEGEELPTERIDLLAVIRETAEALGEQAEKSGVSLTVTGEGAAVYGPRRLVEEIAFNLCDNAVKYNREGGSVTLTAERDGEDAVLRVTDTGVGIPYADQSREFERFYRLDKSHSRATGAPGWGCPSSSTRPGAWGPP